VALTVALTVGHPGAPAAQDLPPDPDSALIEELVVTASYPGPVFWRVSRGEARVWVLGVPSLAPKRQVWERQLFSRYLAASDRVILPFNGLKVRLAGSPAAALGYIRLRSGRPFEAGLPPDGAARFASARERLGQPAARYAVNHPLAAGLMLHNDWMEANALTTTDPAKLIRLLARDGGKTVVQRTYDLGPLLGDLARTPRVAGEACLEAVLDEVPKAERDAVTEAVPVAEDDAEAVLDGVRSEEGDAVEDAVPVIDEEAQRDTVGDTEADGLLVALADSLVVPEALALSVTVELATCTVRRTS
jgi:hypothetical protein